jgi:hypothetical protein
MTWPVAFVLLAATCTSARGQEADPLVTDRPDFTESASTVAPGRLQLEAGYTFSREGGTRTHAFGEVLARIGLHPLLELRVGLNSFVFADGPSGDDEGFEDLVLGTKIRLLRPAASEPLRPAAALLLGAFIPTGATGISGERLTPEAKLALAWELTPQLSLGSNLNVASVEAAGMRFAQFSGSLALGIAVAARLAAFVEVFGFTASNPAGQDAGFLNGGLTFPASEDLQFDARVGIGVGDPDPNYFAGVGFALRL